MSRASWATVTPLALALVASGCSRSPDEAIIDEFIAATSEVADAFSAAEDERAVSESVQTYRDKCHNVQQLWSALSPDAREHSRSAKKSRALKLGGAWMRLLMKSSDLIQKFENRPSGPTVARDVLLTLYEWIDTTGAMGGERPDNVPLLSVLQIMSNRSPRQQPRPPEKKPPETLERQAVRALQAKQYDRAVELLNSELKERPRNAHALSQRGNAYAAKGELARALADFSAAIEIDPTNATYRLRRGQTHSLRCDHEAAKVDLAEAARLDPRYERLLEEARQARNRRTQPGPPSPKAAPASRSSPASGKSQTTPPLTRPAKVQKVQRYLQTGRSLLQLYQQRPMDDRWSSPEEIVAVFQRLSEAIEAVNGAEKELDGLRGDGTGNARVIDFLSEAREIDAKMEEEFKRRQDRGGMPLYMVPIRFQSKLLYLAERAQPVKKSERRVP